ncbi:MAG TPA: thiamine pyrophosphate-dependent enzyme [Candidatus Binatia bacterium]|jgi:thiamine pyrophosphate-dependent acetolactate synthase large subunit-like protein
MKRYDCLEYLAPLITDQLIVTSQSGQRIEWGHLSKHEGNLLLGEMGAALAVAAGIAAALPHRRVIALESDGSVLLTLSSLATVANLGIDNLSIFVFDNGAYSGTRISEPTATNGRTDLAEVALGAGIERSVTVHDLEAFKRQAKAALGGKGLNFIVCKVEESLLHRDIPRPDVDLQENKYKFVRYIQATEGKLPPFIGRG